MKRLLFIAVMIIQSLGFTPPASAVEDCPHAWLDMVSGMLGGYQEGIFGDVAGYGTQINFKEFEKSKKVLLLGDSGSQGFSMGAELHEKFPTKEIVSTDFSFKETISVDGLTRMHVDHMKPLPFQEDAFDTIVLRRGLCVCHHGKACAGFCATNHEAKEFFEKIVRVLDKKNPNAIAILHGQAGTGPKQQNLWKQQLEELELKYPIQVKFMYASQHRHLLNSIIITPRTH